MQPNGDASELVGSTLNGAYRVLRRITHGGMGTIFEAEQVRLPGKRYAIKILHLIHNAVAMQRFQREAVITSDLGHDHIVDVYDFNVAEDGTPYFVMELLEGEDLAKRLRRAGPMPLDQVVQIARQVALGIDAAHRAGVVHRDLKPNNLFLCQRDGRDDFVKILDFGVSKVRDSAQAITKENTLMGTPNYMSPEQADGLVSDVDHRTDIFALGTVVWEMLTGVRAFDAPTVSATLYRVVHAHPTPVHQIRPDVPEQVDAVLRVAMAKAKRARQASVLLFANQLAEAAEHGAVAVPVDPSSFEEDTVVERRRAGPDDTKRVLFVDDSPSMCAMVSMWLTQAGYDVVLAHDGEEAAAMALAAPTDLVIADVNMPRRDGFALCRALKQDPVTSGIPVILFTRLDEATDVVNGLAAGADAFVIKGSGAKDLLRQVEQLLPDAVRSRTRKRTAIASLDERSTRGRKAIFQRLFDAFFREVPFDIVALLVERAGSTNLMLLGSHYELSNALAADVTAKMVESYASLSGRPRPLADLESQLIVIDETAIWGDADAKLQRSVMVPMLDGEHVIGCLGVFSFEDTSVLDANIRFFFDIGVAAARALRHSVEEGSGRG